MWLSGTINRINCIVNCLNVVEKRYLPNTKENRDGTIFKRLSTVLIETKNKRELAAKVAKEKEEAARRRGTRMYIRLNQIGSNALKDEDMKVVWALNPIRNLWVVKKVILILLPEYRGSYVFKQ